MSFRPTLQTNHGIVVNQTRVVAILVISHVFGVRLIIPSFRDLGFPQSDASETCRETRLKAMASVRGVDGDGSLPDLLVVS